MTDGNYWDVGVIWGGGSMYMADPDKFTMFNVRYRHGTEKHNACSKVLL